MRGSSCGKHILKKHPTFNLRELCSGILFLDSGVGLKDLYGCGLREKWLGIGTLNLGFRLRIRISVSGFRANVPPQPL